jgi:hypothetical protein
MSMIADTPMEATYTCGSKAARLSHIDWDSLLLHVSFFHTAFSVSFQLAAMSTQVHGHLA